MRDAARLLPAGDAGAQVCQGAAGRGGPLLRRLLKEQTGALAEEGQQVRIDCGRVGGPARAQHILDAAFLRDALEEGGGVEFGGGGEEVAVGVLRPPRAGQGVGRNVAAAVVALQRVADAGQRVATAQIGDAGRRGSQFGQFPVDQVVDGPGGAGAVGVDGDAPALLHQFRCAGHHPQRVIVGVVSLPVDVVVDFRVRVASAEVTLERTALLHDLVGAAQHVGGIAAGAGELERLAVAHGGKQLVEELLRLVLDAEFAGRLARALFGQRLRLPHGQREVFAGRCGGVENGGGGDVAVEDGRRIASVAVIMEGNAGTEGRFGVGVGRGALKGDAVAAVAQAADDGSGLLAVFQAGGDLHPCGQVAGVEGKGIVRRGAAGLQGAAGVDLLCEEAPVHVGGGGRHVGAGQNLTAAGDFHAGVGRGAAHHVAGVHAPAVGPARVKFGGEPDALGDAVLGVGGGQFVPGGG